MNLLGKTQSGVLGRIIAIIGVLGIVLWIVLPFLVSAEPDTPLWTSRTSPTDNNWTSITHGNGQFVAVAESGINNRIMTSGIFWTPPPPTVDESEDATDNTTEDSTDISEQDPTRDSPVNTPTISPSTLATAPTEKTLTEEVALPKTGHLTYLHVLFAVQLVTLGPITRTRKHFHRRSVR
jgi:hypothetical protein